MNKTGIIIESSGGQLTKSCAETVFLGRQQTSQVTAFVIAQDAEDLKENLKSSGITDIIQISLKKDQENNPAVQAKALGLAVKHYGITTLLGASSAWGKDLLPRTAAALEAPLVMNCIHVDIQQHQARTYQYSGKTIATVNARGPVCLFGIRPNSIAMPQEPDAFPKEVEAELSVNISIFDQTGTTTDPLKLIKQQTYDQGGRKNLAEADIIISGGRGMKHPDNFNLLFKCAALMDAAAGASRVAVDEGWVPYAMQVGQTGEKVSPKVYIACGISGSIQHFAGMKTSRLVIAINTDKEAPIISNSDYYAIADVLEVLPALQEILNVDQ